MAPTPATTTWAGTPECDLNPSHPLKSHFFDARLRTGQWALLCPACAKAQGITLGRGHGQRYDLREGRWHKTAG